MKRQSCILIGAIIYVPYDKAQFGEANRAETIATNLAKVVGGTIGVKMKKWDARHAAVAEDEE